MSVFEVDSLGQRYQDSRAQSERSHELSAGTFEGMGQGIGDGFMRGGAKAAQFISMAGATVPIAIDYFRDSTEAQDWYFENVIDDVARDAVEYWTPHANEVGKAGQVLGGLAEIALPLMASAGNPSLMMGAQGIGTGMDLVESGVDPYSASAVGTVESMALGLGFKIPFLGNTLSKRIALGAAGNLALDMPTRAVQQSILEAGEYNDQAQIFDPFDAEAMAISALTGAVFGGISHLGNKKVRAADVEATATANNARHFQDETAIGRPSDIAASQAHQEALSSAVNQLSEGQPVSVPERIFDADFVPRPKRNLIQEAIREEYGILGDQLTASRAEFSELPRMFSLDDIATQKPSNVDADSIEVIAAREALSNKPELSVLDEDGKPMLAREALEQADIEAKNIETEAKAYRAAVACFLRTEP